MNARDVVDAIFNDLDGRAGFDGVINEVESDILEEMLEGWTDLVQEAMDFESKETAMAIQNRCYVPVNCRGK